MDYTKMSDEELYEVIEGAKKELGRRQTIQLVNDQVAEVLRTARASGAIDTPARDAEWVQPTGAHDAYLKGDEVEHDDKLWVSTVDYNVWEPGVSGWREKAGTDEDGNEVPADWIQPTGTHDAYHTGDRVTFEGEVWESVIDNNTWSPTDYPQGWEKVDAEPEDV